MINLCLSAALLSLLTLQAAPRGALHVRHDHDPWGDCRGTLVVGPEGLEYRPEKEEKHQRLWNWEEIQSIDRKAEDRFSILTYEDLRWRLGQDRFFDFQVLDGSGLDEEIFDWIAAKLGKPVINRVPTAVEAVLEIPSKHLHTFGGCQGSLRFGSDWIVYESSTDPSHSRSWKRNRDLETAWSSGRYHIEFQVHEPDRRSFGALSRVRFHLKQPLPREFYERLRREMAADW